MESRPKSLLNTVEAYMSALSKKDQKKLLALLTDDIIIRDPVGEHEYAGKETVTQYINALFETWFYYEMRIDNYYPGGDNRLAVRWSVSGTAVNNKTADFSGISMYVFQNTNAISSIESYWYYQRVLAQIKDE